MWPPTKVRRFGFDLKYIVTTLIAVCALFVAGTTAFFTTLRIADDVRVIVPELPIVLMKSENEITMWRRNTFTFINAGTRSVAISSIYLYFQQRVGLEVFPKNGCGDTSAILLYDMEPYVIKAGDIVHKVIFLSSIENGKEIPVSEQPDIVLPVDKKLKDAKDLRYRICVDLDMSTPDEDYLGKEIIEYDGDAKDDGVHLSGPEETKLRPIQLLYNSRFLLWPHRD